MSTEENSQWPKEKLDEWISEALPPLSAKRLPEFIRIMHPDGTTEQIPLRNRELNK